jgi:hypothetical protein
MAIFDSYVAVYQRVIPPVIFIGCQNTGDAVDAVDHGEDIEAPQWGWAVKQPW